MESKTTPFRAHALRVLVAEDNEDTATSLSMLLRMYGYDVEVAADGPSALRAVHTSPPDVILLDIAHPKMNGWEVARQIHEECVWKRPLTVAITGHGMDADRLSSQEAGIDLHLVKPVAPEELHKLLSRFESIVSIPAS
jgi:CheY-like chemotaxis protein